MLKILKSRLELVALGVIILVGCSQVVTENIAPLETPTQEIVQLAPTVDLDTPTTLPTRTPRREPIVEGTITPTLTISQAASATSIHAFGQCQRSFDERRMSPRKDWYLCERGDLQGADMMVIHQDGRTWRFFYKDVSGVEYFGDIRYFAWTQDEAFLYFGILNPGDGPYPITANAEALFRMDLSDGSVSTLLGTLDYNNPNRDMYVASISPTSRRMAYSDGFIWHGEKPQTKLHLVDLQSGAETVLSMDRKYSQLGDFMWSEDGLYLAYKLYTFYEDYCKYSYSIALLDITNMSPVSFLQDVPVEQCGNEPAVHEILSVSNQEVILEFKGEKWIYEIENQKLHKLN